MHGPLGSPSRSVAYGEISQARDLLNSLLSTANPNNTMTIPSSLQPHQQSFSQPAVPEGPPLSATVVNKQPPILSLQAFNAQIVIGSKDEALRKAASLFDTVATRIEKSQQQADQYWVNALKIRRNNWRLMPSPLPAGSPSGKGADKTSKDFLVCYGLEECSLYAPSFETLLLILFSACALPPSRTRQSL